MSTYRCPVLLFTPQVLAWQTLFGQTHRVEVLPSGALRWVRQALIVSGGIHDQPALDLAAVDWIASVMARLTGEQAAEQTERRRIRTERRAAAEQRRVAREGMGEDAHG